MGTAAPKRSGGGLASPRVWLTSLGWIAPGLGQAVGVGNPSAADLYTLSFAESSAIPPARTAQIRRGFTFASCAIPWRAEIFALPVLL
jgi:hypothetical protein